MLEDTFRVLIVPPCTVCSAEVTKVAQFRQTGALNTDFYFLNVGKHFFFFKWLRKVRIRVKIQASSVI